MRHLYVFFIFFTFAFFMVTPLAKAKHEKKFDTFTIYWENDAFAGTDRDYTNGFKLTWSTPFKIDRENSHLPDWSYPVINSLPFVNDPSKYRAVSWSIGQNIYTPVNIGRTDLIEDDRPYAGETYFATGFHNKTYDKKTSWELRLGVVGPLSFAEEVQNGVHNILGIERAEGWDHQLKNEITFEVICESQRRLYRSEKGQGPNYDLISHLGGRIGNVNIYGNAGAEARFGWNLPKDFGSCPIRAGCETNSAFNDGKTTSPHSDLFRIHFFTAIDGRVVLRDIFLDGNTFTDSHSVEKEYFVADIMIGIAIEYGSTRASYSYIYRTKQFKDQGEDQVFGAFSISWPF